MEENTMNTIDTTNQDISEMPNPQVTSEPQSIQEPASQPIQEPQPPEEPPVQVPPKPQPPQEPPVQVPPEPQPIEEPVGYTYHTEYTANQSAQGMDHTPLSMGEWILTILAIMIPCFIGVGIYFYWAFTKNGNINRRNYCRASLIVTGVISVIYLVFMLLFGVAFLSSMN